MTTAITASTVGDLLDRKDAERLDTQTNENGGGLVAVIERALANPDTGIDTLERLLAMQERVQARDAKMAFTAAMRAMRPALPFVTMKGKIVIRDKADSKKIIQETAFARFEDIHETVMPILTEHGFDLSFRNGLSPDGKVRVTTVLDHEAGHSEETFFDVPHDSSGSKNAVQAIGSSTSYGKRYGMVSILNIRIHGDDDDAHTATPEACISKVQREAIDADLDRAGKDKRKFCTFMKVEALADISVADFDKARRAVDSALKAAGL